MPEESDHRRLKRMDIPGHARYLTFSCFHGRPFLNAPRSRQWLADAIDRARRTHGYRLWAWVIMPEHVHLLIWPRNEHPHVGPILTSIKQSVSRRAVAWATDDARDQLDRMADVAPDGQVTHRFWQRGAGYDRNVWTDQAIWKSIDYIHDNPVRRGLYAKSTDWEWSSAREHERLGPGLIALDRGSVPLRKGNR